MFVIQPTGRCNLNCRYCYLPEQSRRSNERMSDAVLERAAALVLRSSLVGDSLTVLWHAGEPLAAGVRFFDNALALLEKNNIHARTLNHSVQTNGTMIDSKWCDFFLENDFSVGVSIDGPEFLHNLNRRGWSDQGSFASTMRGIENLKRAKLDVHGICVLTRESLQYPDEIFDFFVNHGFSSIGFNAEEIEAHHLQSSILPVGNGEGVDTVRRQYIAFMERLMDRWIESEGDLYIREFEGMSGRLVTIATRPNFALPQDVNRGMTIVTVKVDGSITTFSPELATGTKEDPHAFVVGHVNVLDELEDIIGDPRYLSQRRAIVEGIAKCRAECSYFGVCGGGWPSNKYAETGTFSCSETHHCSLHVKALADVVFERFASRPEFMEAIDEFTMRETVVPWSGIHK